MVRVMPEPSAPSANTNLPRFKSAPHISSSVMSGTPVNSLQLSMPCVYCTVGTAVLFHSIALLAPHSIKHMRLTLGRRMISSISNTIDRFSMLSSEPLIIRRCFDGSMSHQPWWCRSKCKPLGVMMPNSDCSGAKLTLAAPTRVKPGLSRRCRFFSNSLGRPYGRAATG